jgi:glycosyltransferase involved in cell wall biosynthesis
LTNSDFTFCVCTFNSEKTLGKCLQSINMVADKSKVLVVDHNSTDATIKIAEEFGAEIIFENVGLGRARQVCFENVTTKYLVFVDSDVEILARSFVQCSTEELEKVGIGAVVGMSLGHKFSYGLPASLLVLRQGDFRGKIVPDYIDARETFFIQKRLDSLGLKTTYLFGAMRHESQFRKYKPEWEGANTRILPSSMLKELGFTTKVIVLLTLNSRNSTNLLYLPIFYLKFLRGFLNPQPWLKIRRSQGAS